MPGVVCPHARRAMVMFILRAAQFIWRAAQLLVDWPARGAVDLARGAGPC
ncbi:hypothetical protein A2U01_0095070, partial [Trifolium medium]|nr:hypothetical protein [Trifolium medium]